MGKNVIDFDIVILILAIAVPSTVTGFAAACVPSCGIYALSSISARR